MSTPPAGWYPDQAQSQLLRWWDGLVWTDHTRPGEQPPQPPQQAPAQRTNPLYSEPMLIVSQRAWSGLTAAYDVFDQHQQQVGSVNQVDKSGAARALRFLSSNARGFLTKRYEVRGAQGQPLLTIEQPAKTFKSKFTVSRADGTLIGDIEQRNLVGKARLAFSVNGAAVGELAAESWASRNFAVTDEHGRQVATVAKRNAFDKTSVKEVFTTDDSYVLERPQPLPEPFGSLVVATALCLDAAFYEQQEN